MIELFNASIAMINLPFTVMLGLVVIYWLSVIVGVLDIESFDVDMDADIDLDVDVDVDVDVDADVDMDMDADADADVSGDGNVGIGRGVFSVLFSFLNIGEVPVMIILSVMVFWAWSFSILANYYLNPGHGGLTAFGLLIPNFLSSYLVTGIVTRPFRVFFRALHSEMVHTESMVDKAAVVVTSKITTDFGQVEIVTDGAPITLNARTENDEVILKKETVIIYDKDTKKDVYLVTRYDG